MKRLLSNLLAILFLLIGLIMAGTGTFLAAAGGTEGKITNSAGTATGSGRALVFNDFAVDTGGVDTSKVVEMTVGAKSLNGKPLFIGLAPTSEVVNYLNDVQRDVVTGISTDNSRVTPINGSATPQPPTSQTIWLESASGTEPSLVLPASTVGSTLVVMNEDASSNVAIDLTVGVESQRVFYGAIGLLIIGVLLTLLSILFFRKAGKAKREKKAAKLAAHQQAAAGQQVPNQIPQSPATPQTHPQVEPAAPAAPQSQTQVQPTDPEAPPADPTSGQTPQPPQPPGA